jgi:hypothetical protein
MSMADFFEQAIAAAQRGEQLSREADIATFKALIGKDHWNDTEMDTVTDLWCRAGLDPLLNEQMEALQNEWLQSEGFAVTPEDSARARKRVKHIIKQWEDKKP